MAQDYVKPAVLPDTPSQKAFPIPEEKLIELCKKLSNGIDKPIGVEDESVLADDFRFEFPLIKLDKKRYLDIVRTFDIKSGIPNIAYNAYDYRVDKYEPQRVWYTTRVSGLHTGPVKIFNKYEFKPTGRKVLVSPEAMSMTFNAAGKVTSLTGGYVMDNRLGNNNKLGGLLGILACIGVNWPYPQPGTLGWKVGIAVDTGVNFITKALHFVTFGIFREKQKLA